MLQGRRADIGTLEMSTTESLQLGLSVNLKASASRAQQSAMVVQMEHIILLQGQEGLGVME